MFSWRSLSRGVNQDWQSVHPALTQDGASASLKT